MHHCPSRAHTCNWYSSLHSQHRVETTCLGNLTFYTIMDQTTRFLFFSFSFNLFFFFLNPYSLIFNFFFFILWLKNICPFSYITISLPNLFNYLIIIIKVSCTKINIALYIEILLYIFHKLFDQYIFFLSYDEM